MKTLARLVPVLGMVFAVACGQTDAGITTSVKSKLAADDTVRASQVDVDTQNHVVTLRGSVASEAAKTRAVALARETNGVRDVIDELRIAETAATSGVDTDATTSAAPSPTENRVTEGAKDTGNAAKEGAKSVAEGAKEGAKGIGEGAKKIGKGIRDAVTDKDRDSDKDGK
jgi:hypothetical protein